MTDLATRLLSAIGERERAAKKIVEVYPEPWDVSDRGWMARVVADGPHFREVVRLEQNQLPDDCEMRCWLGDVIEHVVLNGPDAVLRRCAADRKIVEMCLATIMTRMEIQNLQTEDQIAEAIIRSAEAMADATLTLLAEGYGIEEDT